jgi:tRNA(fMet)-specific endonuclease VapC
MILLDTSVCIDLLRGEGGPVATAFAQWRPSEVAVSAVTAAELWSGVEQSRRRDENARRVALFLSEIATLPFDAAAAERFGGVQAELVAAGIAAHVDEYDKLIAAHALATGRGVITANPKDFRRIAGCSFRDWRTGETGGPNPPAAR